MLQTKKQKKKAIIPPEHCVACGCCVYVCPRKAIQVYRGIYSQVDYVLCVGCSKCKSECPASIVEFTEVEL